VSSPPLRLFDHELHEGAYKVRLFLSLLDVSCERRTVDFYPGAETASPQFLAINPVGDLSALVHGSLVLRDSEAILAYLARSFAKCEAWLPVEVAAFGRVMSWLGFARSQLKAAGEARMVALFGLPGDARRLAADARRAFRILDDHMTRQEHAGEIWVAGNACTIADIALFPAVALSRDFGIEHDEFPALRRWIRRLRTRPGFIVMPGIPEFY
jgi:glutathione S-transferase